MKKIISLSIVVIYSQLLFGQQANVSQFNFERQRISNTGLKVLSVYTATNIIYGAIASSKTAGSTRYFHKMNAIWNGITLSLVGIGFLTSKKEGNISFSTSLTKQAAIEKLFLFNAGLDLAYIASGAYLKERSQTSIKNPQRLKGYGESVMLQGGVLFLFDGIMYTIHNRHGKKLTKLADKIQLSTANGVGLVIKL